MGREVKRVPLDFDWPMEKIWEGYLRDNVQCPDCKASELHSTNQCTTCHGDGMVCDPIEPPAGEGWQVWENVSEGSPVTPVFETSEKLATYLYTVGDVWCQKRPDERPPSPQAASQFIRDGSRPSFVLRLPRSKMESD